MDILLNRLTKITKMMDNIAFDSKCNDECSVKFLVLVEDTKAYEAYVIISQRNTRTFLLTNVKVDTCDIHMSVI